MSFIYLASPYTHNDPAIRAQRHNAVCSATAALMRAGHIVFSPIAHSHPVEVDGIGEPMCGNFWKRQDIPLLRHAEILAVLMLEGWDESKGIAWEIETAEALHMPVHYLRPDDPTAGLENRFDLIAHLHRQQAFSLRTFGPGARTRMVLDHARKELDEIEGKPGDLMEWVDLLLLAFDGALRAGFPPEEVAHALSLKQTKNEGRDWPDWRTADPDKAIEHVRERETA